MVRPFAAVSVKGPPSAPSIEFVVGAFVVGVIGAIAYARWAKKKQDATGEQSPVGLVALGLIIGLPLIALTRLLSQAGVEVLGGG